jgi:hypothetical protein
LVIDFVDPYGKLQCEPFGIAFLLDGAECFIRDLPGLPMATITARLFPRLFRTITRGR